MMQAYTSVFVLDSHPPTRTATSQSDLSSSRTAIPAPPQHATEPDPCKDPSEYTVRPSTPAISDEGAWRTLQVGSPISEPRHSIAVGVARLGPGGGTTNGLSASSAISGRPYHSSSSPASN